MARRAIPRAHALINIGNERKTIMAHVISDDCVKCGACKETCPAGAISDADGKCVIDAGTCVDCGACAAGCPVEAIAAE